MKKKETTIEVQYQIRAIEILESSLNTPQSPVPENILFKFDINLEHRLNNEKKLIIVVCTVSIRNKNKEQLFGHLKTSCVFNVNNWEEFIDKDSNKLKFPTDFLTQLNSITISSTRGLLFSALRGTFLHNAVLPIIDLQSFVVSKK